MDYLEWMTDHARREASHILDTDRAVITKRIYRGKPYVLNLRFAGGCSVVSVMDAGPDRTYLSDELEKADGAGHCERCDSIWPAKNIYPDDKENPICGPCCESLPTPEEIAADKGDIDYHAMRDGD